MVNHARKHPSVSIRGRWGSSAPPGPSGPLPSSPSPAVSRPRGGHLPLERRDAAQSSFSAFFCCAWACTRTARDTSSSLGFIFLSFRGEQMFLRNALLQYVWWLWYSSSFPMTDFTQHTEPFCRVLEGRVLQLRTRKLAVWFIIAAIRNSHNNTVLLHCSPSSEVFLVLVDPSVSDHWLRRHWRSSVRHAFGSVQPWCLVCKQLLTVLSYLASYVKVNFRMLVFVSVGLSIPSSSITAMDVRRFPCFGGLLVTLPYSI